LEHLHKLCVAKGPVEGPRDFRNQVAYYLKGIPHTARTKVAITDATEEAVMHDLLVKFLERMTATIQHQPVRRYRN
ncbi:tRNA dihydrouridine synthase DusB, partial [Levilactobacillus brevis]|nr:tRNA dihydrouridine synthase DusB [Levilactobacillus brevis]